MKPEKYILKEEWGYNEKYPAGTVVYEQLMPDYGLASDDTAITGEIYTSVTLSDKGDYPGFTVPVRLLEKPRTDSGGE